jgi:hypothetical protein
MDNNNIIEHYDPTDVLVVDIVSEYRHLVLLSPWGIFRLYGSFCSILSEIMLLNSSIAKSWAIDSINPFMVMQMVRNFRVEGGSLRIIGKMAGSQLR